MLSWVVKRLRDVIGSADSRICEGFTSESLVLVQIFKKVCHPAIKLSHDEKVDMPPSFNIKIGGSKRVYAVLIDTELFMALPLNMQKGILDLLSLLLVRGTTYVIRFQCHGSDADYSHSTKSTIVNSSSSSNKRLSLTKILLKLLECTRQDRKNLSISKRIVHLIGLTASAGLSLTEMREVLYLLRSPNDLCVSVLQAFKSMIRVDNTVVKANPPSFFNLGGRGAGIVAGKMRFPFTNKEYQFFTWFRVEEFENTNLSWSGMGNNDSRGRRSSSGRRNSNSNSMNEGKNVIDGTQHVLALANNEGHGIDLFINDKYLHLSLFFDRGSHPFILKLDNALLKRGVWYHICVKHKQASRMSMFAKDDFSVFLDFKNIYQDSIPYPNAEDPKLNNFKYQIGQNFDGQIAPVYFFSEVLLMSTVELIASVDAGKTASLNSHNSSSFSRKGEGGDADDDASFLGESVHAFGNTRKFLDLLPGVQNSSNVNGSNNAKPIEALKMKILTSYHPSRCMYNHALDIHGGKHGKLGFGTQAWNVFSVRDLLGSIGGISCILSMFPRLLIDNSVEAVHHPHAEDNSDTLETSTDMVDYTPSIKSTSSANNNGSNGSSNLTTHENSSTYNCTTSKSATSNTTSSLDDDTVVDVGLGTSWGVIREQEDFSQYSVLEDNVLRQLLQEMSLVKEDTCIGLILEILSKLLSNHLLYQKEMLSISGIEMIEYALSCVPVEVLRGEGENCVLALKLLRDTVKDYKPLETRLIKCLFLNFNIWWRSSYRMQSCLIQLILFHVKTEKEYFGKLINVGDLLTSMYEYYREVEDSRQDPTDNEQVVKDRGMTIQSFSEFADTRIRTRTDSLNSGRTSESDIGAWDKSWDEVDSVDGSSDDDHFGAIDSRNNSHMSMGRDTSMSSIPRTVHTKDSMIDGEEIVVNHTLSNGQRKALRRCIQSIIVAVIETKENPREEMVDLLGFIAVCKDLQILDEIAQMVLIFIVEGSDNGLISVVTELCKGAEEFAAFILRHVVHRDSEELRCTGIRIITHFYLRLNALNHTQRKLTLKGNHNHANFGSRIMETISDLGHTAGSESIERLKLRGGLALLSEVLSSHCNNSGIRTYAAVLEMLLTKPEDVQSVGTQHRNVFDDRWSPHLGGKASGVNENMSTITKIGVFVTQYMDPDRAGETDKSVFTPAVVPLFLDILPQLALEQDQQQVFSDLLSLLKHSESNCKEICTTQAWHMCMYRVVARLIESTLMEDRLLYHPRTLTSTLTKWADHTSRLRDKANTVQKDYNFLQQIQEKRKTAGNISIEALLEAENAEWAKLRERRAQNKSNYGDEDGMDPDSASKALQQQKEREDKDIWLAIQMKVYGTLLMHSLNEKNGWRELGRTISQAFETDDGVQVHQSILSHFVNELTFTMQWKYREIQRRTHSNSSSEQTAAMDFLDNIFSIMVTVGEHALHNHRCMTIGIPDWKLAKLRLIYQKEVISSRMGRQRRSGYGQGHEQEEEYEDHHYSDDSDEEEGHRDDEYINELTENLLVERIKQRRRMDAGNPLEGDEFKASTTHVEMTSGADIGLGSDVVATSSDEKILKHPYLNDTRDAVDFNEHQWYDLGDPKNATPSIPGAQAALDSGKKRFNISEFLHPIERRENLDKGRMILVLQNLRFFDVFFWPNHLLPLRNSPMMRFNKERLREKLDDEAQEDLTFPPHTLCFSTLSQCFYVLNTLSPLNDLAEVNVNRIHVIVESMHNVSRKTTPVEDLALAAVAHVTFALQAVIQGLKDFYDILGITKEIEIKNVGSMSVEDEESEEVRMNEEEEIFNEMYEDEEMVEYVRDFFDTPAGINLLNFVKAACLFLVSAVELQKDTLSAALDEHHFEALESLAGRIEFDMKYYYEQFEPKGSSDKDDKKGSRSAGANQSHQQGNRAPMHADDGLDVGGGSNYAYTGASVHGGGHADHANHTYDDDSDEEEDYWKTLEKRDRANDIDRVPAPSSLADEDNMDLFPQLAGKITRSTLNRSKGHIYRSAALMHAVHDYKSSEYYKIEKDRYYGAMESHPHAKFHNNPHPKPEFNVQSEATKGPLKGQVIIKILQWLRDGYFTMNLNRNLGLVKSIAALEYHEANCLRGYMYELSRFNTSFNLQRDAHYRNVEEMNELNHFGMYVSKHLAFQHQRLNHVRKASNNLKLKSVAKKWSDCVRTFKADWSPWHDDNGSDAAADNESSADEKSTSDGKTTEEEGEREKHHELAAPPLQQYELSRHKDSRLRRMFLTRLDYTRDHRDAAYQEGKERDQLLYELGLDADTATEEEIESAKIKLGLDCPSDHQDTDKGAFSNILKDVQIANISSVDKDMEWGDDDDSDDDDAPENDVAGLASTDGSGASPMGDLDVSFFEDDAHSVGTAGLSIDSGGNSNMSSTTLSKTLKMFGNKHGRRPDWTEGYHWTSNEKILLQQEGSRITIDKVISGSLLLTNKYLYFHPKKLIGGLALQNKTKTGPVISFHDRRWNLESLCEIYGRRYLLLNCAVELFFADGVEVFFALSSLSELQKFFRCIRKQHVPLLRTPGSLNPRYVAKHTHYTELWQKRQISNFEYIMRLNVMAGRSYNDITQYPVFPWVIQDFESKTLDLSNPDVFRDLSKPIGALNEERLKEIMDRYNSFDEDTPESMKFMYGSHYSSAGVVIYFMIRQEPFTSLAVNLQGGRFDCPDRLFFDVKDTWQGCMKSASDVKELIPEMYCCPELLMNDNHLPLGSLQDNNEAVNDVRLPAWANDSPFEFVRLMKEALESEHVSEHLHEWIDLVFGYKQQGEAAIDAKNLFYYLTYEGAVDIESIKDPLQKEAVKAQVTHFGQTPSQLFKEPHEPRLPKEECLSPLYSELGQLDRIMAYTPHKQLGVDGNMGAVIACRCSADRLITVHADLSICYYYWSAFPDGDGVPFDLRANKARSLPSASSSVSEEILKRRSYIPLPDGSNDDFSEDHDRPVSATYQDMETPSSDNNGSSKGVGGKGRSASEFFSAAVGKVGSFFGRTDKDKEKEEESAKESSQTNNPTTVGDGKGTGESSNPLQSTTMLQEVKLPGAESIIATGTGTPLSVRKSNKSNCDHLTPTSPLSPHSTSSQEDQGNGAYGNNDDGIDFGSYASSEKTESLTHDSLANALPQIDARNVALSVGAGGHGRIVTCGYWDSTLKVHALDSLKELSTSSGGHVGSITCLQLGQDHCNGQIVITGGEDGTCRVWVEAHSMGSAVAIDDIAYINYENEMDQQSKQKENGMVYIRTLWGHTSPVTCLSYAADMEVVLSGGANGLLCLHTVRKGYFIRSIKNLMGSAVHHVLNTSAGYLLACSTTPSNTEELHLFWTNGQLLQSMKSRFRVETMAVNGSGSVLALGHDNGLLTLRALHSLEFICEYDLQNHGAITSLWFTEDYQFLLIGSKDGHFTVLTDPEARWRVLHSALQKVPLGLNL